MSKMVCPTCRGKGWLKERTYLNGRWVQESACETCKGNGKIPVAEPKTHFETITQSPEKLAAFILNIKTACEILYDCDKCPLLEIYRRCNVLEELIIWLNKEITHGNQEEKN